MGRVGDRGTGRGTYGMRGPGLPGVADTAEKRKVSFVNSQQEGGHTMSSGTSSRWKFFLKEAHF